MKSEMFQPKADPPLAEKVQSCVGEQIVSMTRRFKMKKEKSPRLWMRYGATLLAAVLLFALYSLQSFGSPADNSKGWVWNAFQLKGSTDKVGLGWTSLSCLNDFDNDGYLENQCPTGGAKQYGLSIALGTDGKFNGVDDYVQGCAWSAAYGWVCFNQGASSQCDSGVGTACDELNANGVAIKATMGYCSISWLACSTDADCSAISGQICKPYFTYLDSTLYASGSFSAPAAPQRANILSLWSSTDTSKGYITFPTDPGNAALATSTIDTSEKMFGCFNCDASTKRCGACLNTNTNSVHTALNPKPNILCWNCSNCTVGNPGGSCAVNRDKNTCPQNSCQQCTTFPGVVVNQNAQGQYEMCGWGWHAYNPGISGAGEVYYKALDDAPINLPNYQAVAVAVPTSDRLPIIAYAANDPSDINYWKLTVAKCGDPACTIAKKTAIYTIADNNAISFGRSKHVDISVAVGSDNLPVISFFDGSATAYDLKVVKCGDSACSSGNKVTTVAGDPANPAGLSNSIAVDSGNVPVVSFSQGVWDSVVNDVVNAILKLVKCGNADCTSGNTITTVDPTLGEIDSISMNIYANDYPVISYNNYSEGLKVAKCNSANCCASGLCTNDRTTVASGLGIYTGMALGSDTYPVISYFNGTGLQIAKCNSANCCANNACSNSTVSVDAGSNVYTSLAIGTDGYPVISYMSILSAIDKELRVLKCGSSDCTRGNTKATVDRGAEIARGTALALGADGFPVVSYNDQTIPSDLNKIKYIKCSSANCSVQAQGLGWLAFNPAPIGSPAFVRGEGNVFSGGNIFSPVGPPINRFNAAYLLEATGDITNWFSQQAYLYSKRQQAPSFLKKGTQQPDVYTNVLGRLDYKGLVTDAGGAKNKYGSDIVTMSTCTTQPCAAETQLPASGSLGDKVRYWPSSTIISGGSIFSAAGTSGAGILVVNGDLTITGNVSYASAVVTKSKEIASPVWIVRGDLTVDPVVTQLAGTFVILGDGSPAKCPGVNSASTGCGRFISGISGSQLVVNGLVLARQFKLDRSYSGTVADPQPAEQFVADGRLQSNTPSGLFDFAKSVPRFSFGQ